MVYGTLGQASGHIYLERSVRSRRLGHSQAVSHDANCTKGQFNPQSPVTPGAVSMSEEKLYRTTGPVQLGHGHQPGPAPRGPRCAQTSSSRRQATAHGSSPLPSQKRRAFAGSRAAAGAWSSPWSAAPAAFLRAASSANAASTPAPGDLKKGELILAERE